MRQRITKLNDAFVLLRSRQGDNHICVAAVGVPAVLLDRSKPYPDTLGHGSACTFRYSKRKNDD